MKQLLESLDTEIFQRFDKQLPEPSATEVLQKLETEFPSGIPADYKEFLSTFQGGFILGREHMMNFEPLQFVIAFNHNPTTIEHFNKQVFVFADDQVGGIFFFDLKNQFGKGVNAIFNALFAPLGTMEPPTFCAVTLSEFIQKQVA